MLIVVAVGVNLVMGVAGLFSVASPAFLGLGATSVAILLIHSVPLLPSVLAAVLLGCAIGWLVGLVALRLSGIYFAIITLAFLNVFLAVINWAGPLTGGGYGLVVPIQFLPLVGPLTADEVAVTAVMCAAIVAVLTHFAIHSRVGRAWVAIKNNRAAAELQGINVARTQTQAFALGNTLVTFAGVLQALLWGLTNPNSYSIDVAVAHLSYVVVGGVTPSIIGPIVGPILLFALPQFVHQLGSWLDVFYAGFMLMILLLAPRGIVGAIEQTRARLTQGRH